MPDEDGSTEVEEESFGYSLEGTWKEVVEFGESIEEAFLEHEVEDDAVEDWSSWRPRNDEEQREMREKTVEKAKVDSGNDTAEMADEAAEHLSKSGKKTKEGELGEAAENATESAKSAGKAVEGAGRDALRKVEEVVYRRITKTNPLYFDTPDFNASLEKLSSIVGDKVKKALNGNKDEDDEERRYRLTIKPQSEGVEDALGREFDEED